MVLGSRGSGWRCLLVWMFGTATALAVLALLRAGAPALGLTRPWRVVARLDTLPFDRALVELAGGVLQCSVLWGWLAGSVTVLEAWRGVVPGHRRPWHLPAGLRRLLLTGCGVALATGIAAPALAAPHHLHRDRDLPALLNGLPLPSRAVLPDLPGRATSPPQPVRLRAHKPPRDARGPVPRGRRVSASPEGPASPGSLPLIVRAGDSLWSLAAQDLPPGATDAEISVRWQAIYAANRSVVGPDPGLLLPGQRLVLPREDPS